MKMGGGLLFKERTAWTQKQQLPAAEIGDGKCAFVFVLCAHKGTKRKRKSSSSRRRGEGRFAVSTFQIHESHDTTRLNARFALVNARLKVQWTLLRCQITSSSPGGWVTTPISIVDKAADGDSGDGVGSEDPDPDCIFEALASDGAGTGTGAGPGAGAGTGASAGTGAGASSTAADAVWVTPLRSIKSPVFLLLLPLRSSRFGATPAPAAPLPPPLVLIAGLVSFCPVDSAFTLALLRFFFLLGGLDFTHAGSKLQQLHREVGGSIPCCRSFAIRLSRLLCRRM